MRRSSFLSVGLLLAAASLAPEPVELPEPAPPPFPPTYGRRVKLYRATIVKYDARAVQFQSIFIDSKGAT